MPFQYWVVIWSIRSCDQNVGAWLLHVAPDRHCWSCGVSGQLAAFAEVNCAAVQANVAVGMQRWSAPNTTWSGGFAVAVDRARLVSQPVVDPRQVAAAVVLDARGAVIGAVVVGLGVVVVRGRVAVRVDHEVQVPAPGLGARGRRRIRPDEKHGSPLCAPYTGTVKAEFVSGSPVAQPGPLFLPK